MSESAENSILKFLSTSPTACIEDTYTWSESSEAKLDHKAVVGGVKSLLVDAYLIAEELTTSFYVLTAEGEQVVANGSQEMIVFAAVNKSEGGLTMPELQAAVGKNICKVGMGNCMKNKWLKKQGDKLVSIKAEGEVSDSVQASLNALKEKDGAVDALDQKVSLQYFCKIYPIFGGELILTKDMDANK